MTYVIAGVSGHTGAAAADALLSQGKKVRVVVRDRAKGSAWAARGAEVAVADLGDREALAAALGGAQGAYLLVPPNMAAPNFREYQDRTTDAIVSALEKSAIPHVVFLSSIAAQHAEGNGPIRALHRAEGLLRRLPKTRATMLRAAYFMENHAGSFGMLAQGVFPSFTPAALAYDQIATADIGRLAATLLVEGTSAHQVVEQGGPKYSANDAAAALTELTGKPVRVQEVPVEAMGQTLAGFGIPREVADMYQEMTAGLIRGHVVFEGGHRRVQGTTSLKDVLAKLLAGAPK